MSISSRATLSIEGSRTQPIYIWGSLGIFFLVLQIYIFGSWILSDQFATVRPGTDPMPWYTEMWVIVFQILCIPLSILLMTWGVKQCRREGRVTVTMLFIFGWLFTYWQDPMGNYFRLYFTYNAHMINFGSWVNFIPGWIMPNGHNFAEPVVFLLGAYTSIMPLQIFACAWVLRRVKVRRPQISTFGLIGVAFLIMALFDLIIEGAWVRAGLYAFTGSVHSWSIWGGQWYQFPVYEAIFWGAAMTAVTSLYFFRNDKGETLVEQGMDSIASPGLQTFWRMMAIMAVFNLAYLSYNIIVAIITFWMDQTPAMPNYLSHGLCGPGTEYLCPGPTHPTPLPASGPMQELDCALVANAGGRPLSTVCDAVVR